MQLRKWSSAGLILAVAASVPLLTQTPYFLRVMTQVGLYVMLAVGYHLVVGQVGSFSLAHPAFYGIGAYSVAILTVKAGWPLPLTMIMAAIFAALAAVAIGLPSFRLHERSFAIGTLGFVTVLQLVANNWIDLTEGPMCITGVPAFRFSVGGYELSSIDLTTAYYGVLVLAALSVGLVAMVNRSRVGRAFRAIRENELLANMQGINPTRYKLMAFAIGAAIAGVAGGYYASWASLVCPSEMASSYTTTLLIILYLGGVTSLRGVTLGAVIFTVLPELLRSSREARLVIYGVLLLVGALYLPEGFEGLLRRAEKSLGRLFNRPRA